MKGYKAFNSDLTCRGMQYEVGKEYVFDGKPIPCRQGFHFCETIADCYEFYPMSDDTRICEVEATGEIAADGVKRVTNVIKILAEITCDNLRKGRHDSDRRGSQRILLQAAPLQAPPQDHLCGCSEKPDRQDRKAQAPSDLRRHQSG